MAATRAAFASPEDDLILPVIAWGYHRGHARWLDACTTWSEAGLPLGHIPQLTPLELSERLRQAPGSIHVLDVREDSEWDQAAEPLSSTRRLGDNSG